MHLSVPSSSCCSAILLFRNLQHLSLLLNWDSATLRGVMYRVDPVRKECLKAMYPDHFLQESDVANVQHVPERNQRYSLRRFPRSYRICVLLDRAQVLEQAFQGNRLHPAILALLPGPVFLLRSVREPEPSPVGGQTRTSQWQCASTR